MNPYEWHCRLTWASYTVGIFTDHSGNPIYALLMLTETSGIILADYTITRGTLQ